MSKQRQALELALEALECALDGKSSRTMERKAVREIKEALAEPEQKPVDPVREAAPDLFESLQEMIQAMVDYEMEVDTFAPKKHRDMMNKAHVAIAKAKGEDDE